MRLRARDGEAVAFKKAPQNFWRIGAVRTHLQTLICANEKQTVFSRLFCISLCYVRTPPNMGGRSSKPARATRPAEEEGVIILRILRRNAR